MTLLAFGINHKTAPVEIREKVTFAPENVPAALQDLLTQPAVLGAAIISTCNRTELYCELAYPNNDSVQEWFHKYHGLNTEMITPYTYIHPDNEAVRHILRVASGLDSMVLGEPQILGQIKEAFATANTAGTLGQLLNRLSQHTFSVAKQVRTDTSIGASAVSVAFAAVRLAKQIFSDLSAHTALLIGAGETIDLVARHLTQNAIKHIIVANRTLARTQTLTKELNAEPIILADMPKRLAEADIVISSTASQLPILGKGAIERSLKLRKHRPMFMVDLAVPRDIEPEVNDLDDIYLYTVDDLKDTVDENRRLRADAAQAAEEIINHQTAHFMGQLRALQAVETIRDYRETAEQFRDQAIKIAQQQLANGKDPQDVLNELAHTLTNKLVHQPSVQLRQAAYEGRNDILAAVREFLNLKDKTK